MADVIVSGTGHDARVRLTAGGSAVNAAVSAAAAGADAEVLGRVGDDAAGRMIQAELAAQGVGSTLGVDETLPTGTFVVVEEEIRAARGANAGFLPEHLPAAVEADATLVSGHLPKETVTAALSRSRAAWNALAVARLDRLPVGGNALFMNEDEVRVLTGTDPASAVDLLGRRYRVVCVTRGAAGAIGVLDGHVEWATVERQQVADARPGAGDALAAAVLVALAKGASLAEALAEGGRSAAVALRAPTDLAPRRK